MIKDNDILSLAIIGAGNIATRHLANLEFLGCNRVAAICDIDLAMAEKMAAGVGAKVYGDFTEMFERESELDAVLLCTPPSLRKRVFQLAAHHGVAVFCEKPPSDTLAEANEIARLVDESGMICSVDFHMRYSPAVDRFVQLTAGRPINIVQSEFLTSAALVPGVLEPWFFIKEKSGGHVMDQAIHCIDLLRFVIGDISMLQTFGNNVICPKTDDFTVEDTTCTNIRFANGASGSHIHTWVASRNKYEVNIMGGDFALSLRPEGPPQVKGTLGAPGSEGEIVEDVYPQGPAMGRSGKISPDRRPEDPPDPPHAEALKIFLEAVRSGDKSPIRSPYEDAIKSLALVLAMNRSIESDQVEKIDN